MSFQTSIASFSRPFLFCLATAIGSVAFAEAEPADAALAAAPQFTLWQGGCSRSLRVLETHSDIHEALRAAERQNQQGNNVILLSGESNRSRAFAVLLVQRKAQPSQDTVECTVYEKIGCRASRWQVITPEGKTDPKTADELTAERTKLGQTVCTVYHVRK